MHEPKSLQDWLGTEVEAFSVALRRRLEVHLAAMTVAPIMTPEVEAHVRNRVGPKSVDKYLSIEQSIALVAFEAADLGHRISQYRYIERYRDHFQPADAAMRIAFHTHIHVMRGNEIYVIMERCKAWLIFAHDLAAALGLEPTKMHKELITRFGKSFKRHLRERHKIVHAHERPSIISRFGNFTAADLDDPKIAGEAWKIIETLFGGLMKAAGETDQPTAPTADVIKKLNDMRLAEVDRECVEMWTILLDCTDKLIDRRRLLPREAVQTSHD